MFGRAFRGLTAGGLDAGMGMAGRGMNVGAGAMGTGARSATGMGMGAGARSTTNIGMTGADVIDSFAQRGSGTAVNQALMSDRMLPGSKLMSNMALPSNGIPASMNTGMGRGMF